MLGDGHPALAQCLGGAQDVLALEQAISDRVGADRVPFIESRQLLALGVSTKEPVGILPGVPPIATVLPGYELSSWNVLAAPAGTPCR